MNINIIKEKLAIIKVSENWLEPNDWYNITTKIVVKYFGSESIFRYYHLTKLPELIFPEYKFLPWLFVNMSKQFWDKEENVLTYLTWLLSKLDNDWNNLTINNLKLYKGSTLLNKYRIHEIPKLLDPNFVSSKLEYNYWTKDKVKEELLKYYQQHNKLPSSITKINGICLYEQMLRVYGNLEYVAKDLNIQTSYHYTTINGDIVQSSYETIVSNFLYLNGIEYTYNQKIADSNYFYDYKIGNIYIEIWGMKLDSYYEKRKLKEAVYKENKLILISLEKELFQNKDLEKINNHLILEMIRYNIKTDNFYTEISNFTKSNYYKTDYLSEMKQYVLDNKITIMPTINEWISYGFRKHISYFKNNKIGLISIRNDLGLVSIRKDNKYWRVSENLRLEVDTIISNIKEFPSLNYLRTFRNDLIIPIRRYYGGYEKVKEWYYS